eukprot:scaffold2808_cov255-Pinguiococcus_pyrenoidosus.AAC.7
MLLLALVWAAPLPSLGGAASWTGVESCGERRSAAGPAPRGAAKEHLGAGKAPARPRTAFLTIPQASPATAAPEQDPAHPNPRGRPAARQQQTLWERSQPLAAVDHPMRLHLWPVRPFARSRSSRCPAPSWHPTPPQFQGCPQGRSAL